MEVVFLVRKENIQNFVEWLGAFHGCHRYKFNFLESGLNEICCLKYSTNWPIKNIPMDSNPRNQTSPIGKASKYRNSIEKLKQWSHHVPPSMISCWDATIYSMLNPKRWQKH